MTREVRPNLFVAGKFFPHIITATTPEGGIFRGGTGTIVCAVLCPGEDLDLFGPGGEFELRALRIFATGRLHSIGAPNIYMPLEASSHDT